MKRFLIMFFILLSTASQAFCEEYTTDQMTVFTENNKFFGLKNPNKEIVIKPEYKKLIRLGKNSWIAQKKNNKFGLIDNNGNILVPLKYSHTERLFDKWVKLGNEKDFGLYDEYGNAVIPPEFTMIEPLFGGNFLTCKKYKYGVYSNKGEKLLDNEFEFIYMPSPKVARIKKNSKWYEIEKITAEEALTLPEDSVKKVGNEQFKITQIFINTGIGAGYSVVTATDYTMKTFSTISVAYEETIDELMLSQGVETVSIFMKLGWLPKFPVVYAKKYYQNLIKPNSGPLNEVRNELRDKME